MYPQFPMFPMQPLAPFHQPVPPVAPPAQVAAAPPVKNDAVQSIINMVALQALRNQAVSPLLVLEPPTVQHEPSGTIFTLPDIPVHPAAPSRPTAQPATQAVVDPVKSSVLASL